MQRFLASSTLRVYSAFFTSTLSSQSLDGLIYDYRVVFFNSRIHVSIVEIAGFVTEAYLLIFT